MMNKIGKERLTITMRKDILDSLDRSIDGEKIRNRSHAIEFIVGRYLGAGISTCVILAAGKPEQSAKPLLRVHNRPIIAYTIEALRLAGIHNILMILSSQDGELKDYLGDGSQWNMHVTYLKDDRGTGTAYSLKLAEPHVSDTFLLLYGDILSNLDLQELIRFHKEQEGVLATLAVTACANPSQYGVTELQGSRVYNIIEKPAGYDRSNLVFSGIAVCEPDLLKFMPEADTSSSSDANDEAYIVRDVLPDMAHRGQIAGYPFSGKWFDVSHAEEYERAQQEWVSKVSDSS